MVGNENRYTVVIKCANCKLEKTIHNIPRGISIDKYLEDRICRKCGCNIIRKRRMKK